MSAASTSASPARPQRKRRSEHRRKRERDEGMQIDFPGSERLPVFFLRGLNCLFRRLRLRCRRGRRRRGQLRACRRRHQQPGRAG
jgi:hypothetical protein